MAPEEQLTAQLRIPLEQTIKHYRIVSKIGAGGMGEVYLAQDTKLDRKVALKILPPEFAEDQDRMSRFVREAKSASALNHPNIITIYEINEFAGTHFIATEFIDGKTLTEYSKSNPVNFKSTLEIAIQIASALDEAHSAGIVHRDIKPDNVMVRANGLVKILDFGIAKLVETRKAERGVLNEEAATLVQNTPPSSFSPHPSTSPGMIIGTANYMSPEQAKGKEIDARTDIFSFGVVLYEMVARRLPFAGESVLEMIGAILKDEPKPLDANVPTEIAKIISKCLRKDRDERYQTIKDVCNDLKEVKQELEFQNKLEKTSSSEKEEPKTQILSATTAGEISPAPTNETIETKPKLNKLLAAALAGILAIGGYFFYHNFATTKQIESIAVMPFVNESGNQDVEYLSDGMTETLISSLSQVPNLSVKARSTVFYYKGKETSPQKIGKELKVQAVLLGRVSQRGNDLKLSLELVNAETQDVIWSEQYNRKQADLVTLQTDIARDVSSKLKSKLSGADVAKVEKNSNVNPEAYQLYLKGLFQMNRRTGESLKQAADLFKQAIEKDPNYAPAYADLGRTLMSFPTWSLAQPKDSYPQVKAAALRALELDDSLGEAHTILGRYLNDFEWDRVGAEKEFRRAIELEPKNPYAYSHLSDILTFQKRFDEAIAAGRRAVELDPLSKRNSLTNSLIAARRFDEAIAEQKAVIQLDPNYADAYWNLGWAYIGKGSYQEAVASLQKLVELDDDLTNKSLLAFAQAKAGNREEAVKQLDLLKQESSKRYVAGYAFALVYIALGKKEEALTWLEKEVEKRSSYTIWYAVDPLLDDVRDEPRFKAMLKRINLPE